MCYRGRKDGFPVWPWLGMWFVVLAIWALLGATGCTYRFTGKASGMVPNMGEAEVSINIEETTSPINKPWYQFWGSDNVKSQRPPRDTGLSSGRPK